MIGKKYVILEEIERETNMVILKLPLKISWKNLGGKNCGNYGAKELAKPLLPTISNVFTFTSNSNIMTNNSVNQHFFAYLAKSITAFCGSFFVSSSTKEFNRLKNFIAS